MSTVKSKWVTVSPSSKRVLDKRAKDVKSNFALIVKESRIAKGYSQDNLARIVGVDRKTINRIENGHFSPNLENVVKILEVLDLKPQRVFAV